MSFIRGRGRNKFVTAGVALLLLLIKFSLLNTAYEEDVMYTPGPIELQNMISYDEFISQLKNESKALRRVIMLPNWIPPGLKLIGVWGRMIIYSYGPVSTLDDADLTISVRPMDAVQLKNIRTLGELYGDFYSSLERDAEILRDVGRNVTVSYINGLYVFVIWDYPEGYRADIKIYDLQNKITYSIVVMDTVDFSYSDLIRIIKSFSPIE